MRAVRGFVIVPYSGLRETVTTVSRLYQSQLYLEIVTGNLQDGVQLAKQAEKDGFDIIISRGGTAEMIRNNCSLPVVNIEISGYDYLRTLRLAGNISGKSALVGFSYITKNARNVNTLLKTTLEIATIHAQEEIQQTLSRLTSEGCDLIIGDVATTRIAKELGIPCLLLQSGEESVDAALKNAIEIVRTYSERLQQLEYLQYIRANSREQVMIRDALGKVVYSDVDLNRFGLTVADLTALFDDSDSVMSKEVLLLRENGTLYIRRTIVENGLQLYYFRWVHEKGKRKSTGISVLNFKMKPAIVDFSKRNNIYDEKTNETAQAFSNCLDPVLIIGDTGVGKAEIVVAIHRNSVKWMQPLIQIDCAATNIPGTIDWLENQTTELANGGSICFENLHALEKKNQAVLKSFLRTLPAGKWRLFATALPEIRQMELAGEFDNTLLQQFSSLSLYIPNLQESHKDLERIVGLDIIDANAKYGKQIAGIEPAAMRLLENHTWQNNYLELRDVVNQMALVCTSSFITEEVVRETLNSRLPGKEETISLQGTLEEIELRIIQKVLEEEKGQLSKTSERLNISRSTLWRKLNTPYPQEEK